MTQDPFLNEPGREPPKPVTPASGALPPPMPPMSPMPDTPPTPQVSVPGAAMGPGTPPPFQAMPVPVQGQNGGSANNWMGTVGLVLSLVCFGLVGLIFGILGLRAAKNGTASNRGMSVAAIVLGGLSTLAVMVVAVLGLAGVLGKSVPANELKVGDCIGDTGIKADTTSADISSIRVIDCAKPHFGEVYYTSTLTGSYPGNASLAEKASSECRDHVPDITPTEDLYINYFYPSSDTWDRGDRRLTCAVVTAGDPLVGPLSDLP